MQFRPYFATTLKRLQLIAAQPVVLNHHDKRNLGDSPVAFYSQFEFTVRYVSEQTLLPHDRAARSNLRMVRPGSMSTVKPLIIRAREACGKILDLASYLAVRRRSHCTSASNWGLPLLCFPALQGTSSLIKSWESTIFCNILFRVRRVLQQRPRLIPCT